MWSLSAAALACPPLKEISQLWKKNVQQIKERNTVRKTPHTNWPLHVMFHLLSWSTSELSSAYEHKMWYHLHEVLHHPWEPVHYGISTWCLANMSLCARTSLIQVAAGHQKSLEKDIWPWKSFRDSQTCLYSLFILFSLKDGYCRYRWKQYLHGLLDKEVGVCLCGTVKHSISPKMPLSFSLGKKKRNSTPVMNRWSRSLSFSRASNMTSALWVSKVSCS